MIANGQLYELEQTSALPTHVNDGFVLPTPLASLEQGNPFRPAMMRRFRLKRYSWGPQVAHAMKIKVTGNDTRTHPHFVEWVMGFPIGYTDLGL